MTRAIVMTLALILIAGVSVGADEKKADPPSEAQIKLWIEQLGHAQYKVREKATQALIKAGKVVVPQLKKALKESEDLEVQTRGKLVLEQVDEVVFGDIYAGRTPANIKLLTARLGGANTQKAVGLALTWLAQHQSPSGKWDGDGFQAQCKKNTCSGVAKMGWVDPGLTALALLPFLGAGNSLTTGKYKDVVKKAVRYLMKIQSADGLVGGKRGHYMYNHAICTLALVEAYGMSKAATLKGPATKAVTWLLRARNPGTAWRYGARDGDNDVSVTSWAASALNAAMRTGMKPSGLKRALKEVGTFVESVTDDSYYITGYRKRPPRGWQGPTSSRFVAPELGVNTANSHKANHTPTAIAGLIRAMSKMKRSDPRMRGAGTVIATMLPVWDTGGGGRLSMIDMYYWYHATQVMFHMGGEYWKQWNKNMKTALVDHQKKKGDEAGSWDPIGAWGFAGGRVYATAMGALMLETYYRYPRMAK